MKLNDRELGTVLAALRLWQNECSNDATDGALWDIATNGDTVQPLLDDEIDELCERLNSGG